MKRLDHYSQYFLRNPQLIKELVGHTSIGPRDTVYDIGAGSGTISSVLASRCQKVISIELEPRIATTLRVNMARYPNVSVQEGDFLTMKLPETPYKIFANIPFHLSSPIIRKVTEASNPPTATYLIVQKQFANKLISNSDQFTSQLGMIIGPEFTARVRRPLKRTDFWPHPNVDTVLLELVPRAESLIAEANIPHYRQFTIDCFSDPKIFQKVIRNNPLVKVGIKPSQMTLNQWVKLYETYYQKS